MIHEEILKVIGEKDFDDLNDEEISALDREIAKTPEGRVLLRRILLPNAKWMICSSAS